MAGRLAASALPGGNRQPQMSGSDHRAHDLRLDARLRAWSGVCTTLDASAVGTALEAVQHAHCAGGLEFE